MNKAQKPVFAMGISASIFMIIVGLVAYIQSFKTRADLIMVKGKIDFIGESFPFDDLYPRDTRFIHIVSHEEVFEIFIGKQPGDFSPKFEQLDKLNIGDEIVLYYSTMYFQKNVDRRFNKNVEYIDKAGRTYFIGRNANRGLGYFSIGSGIFLIILLIILRKTGKIQ